MIKVLLVADVRVHRDGLAALFGREAGIDVVATVGSGEEIAYRARNAQVAVIDAAGEGAVGTVRRVAAATSLPLVALGGSMSDDQIVAFAEAGVLGFVEDEATVNELRAGVESAARGEARCPPRVATTVLRRLTSLIRSQQPAPEASNLTTRERQILQLVAEGLSNKEIARRLVIEVATVKNHVHHILEKLKVQRRDEAVERLRLAEGVASGCGPAPFAG